MTRAAIATISLLLGTTQASAQVFYGPLPFDESTVNNRRFAVIGLWGPLPPPPPPEFWASPLYDPWALPPGWWEPPRIVVVRPPGRVAAPPRHTDVPLTARPYPVDEKVPPRRVAPRDGEALPAPKPLP